MILISISIILLIRNYLPIHQSQKQILHNHRPMSHHLNNLLKSYKTNTEICNDCKYLKKYKSKYLFEIYTILNKNN
jgi:hypothetical protein